MTKRASEENMNNLHFLVVDQAINLMKHGRPVLSKETGEPVIVNGAILFMPPTAAEITAAARILKDNGVDSPALSAGATDEEVDAISDAMADVVLDHEDSREWH